MKVLKALLSAVLLVVIVAVVCGAVLIRRGFRATATPSSWEAALARKVRNLAIPKPDQSQKNPLDADADTINQGREIFLTQCAACHGIDGSGTTPMGRHLYPRVPDLRAATTQTLTDGEMHFIIENGVQFTGMPAWGQSASGIVGRKLEARVVPADPPAADQGGGTCRIGALRRLPSLPARDWQPLAQMRVVSGHALLRAVKAANQGAFRRWS